MTRGQQDEVVRELAEAIADAMRAREERGLTALPRHRRTQEWKERRERRAAA